MFEPTDEYAGVVDRFMTVLRSRGYTETRPAPLTAGDSSVTFINATITPFKAAMAAGRSLGRTCQFQECLRAHGAHPWLYTFGMVGAAADGEHLPVVCRDATAALLAALRPDRPARVAAVIDARDADLVDAMAPVADRTGLRTFVLARSRIGTRWSYGDEYRMSGRGLTFTYQHTRASCAAQCRPDCDCGRWQQLGNVIAVAAAGAAAAGGRGYVEVGVGVETVIATSHDGDFYRIPQIRAASDRIAGDGWPMVVAMEMVNLYRALGRLAAHGAVPAPRGPGSVVRRLATRLADLHAGNRGVADLGGYAAGLGAPQPLLELLAGEEDRRAAGRRQRLAGAARRLRRRTDTTDDELRGTYGLSDAEIHEVRAAGGIRGA